MHNNLVKNLKIWISFFFGLFFFVGKINDWRYYVNKLKRNILIRQFKLVTNGNESNGRVAVSMWACNSIGVVVWGCLYVCIWGNIYVWLNWEKPSDDVRGSVSIMGAVAHLKRVSQFLIRGEHFSILNFRFSVFHFEVSRWQWRMFGWLRWGWIVGMSSKQRHIN